MTLRGMDVLGNFCHYGALDSVELKANRLIRNDPFMELKILNLDYRRKVACLTVFYWIHFGECAQEIFKI